MNPDQLPGGAFAVYDNPKHLAFFATHYQVDEDTGCWNWTGSKTRQGYPRFKSNGREIMAHRLAWMISRGRETADLIGHTCGNFACVNPDHLYVRKAGSNDEGRRRPTRFTPNDVRFDGDIAFIAIRTGGKFVEALVDRDKAESVLSAGRWHLRGADEPYPALRYRKNTGMTNTVLHRLVLGCGPEILIDHINRNPLDCRCVNLRIVTYSQNGQNRSVRSKSNAGFRNVYLQNGRYRVSVNIHNVTHYAGTFGSVDEAAAAASLLRQKIHSHSPENSLCSVLNVPGHAPDEVEDALDAYYELSRGEAMDQAEEDAYDRAMTFSGYD